MRCKTVKVPERLLLFPSPYPGESFYSILCRYHVRSGNRCDQHTIHQLFGKSISLHSTLLSPYHIQYAENWFFPNSGLNAESLLRQHTAFNLFALRAGKYECSSVLAAAFRKSKYHDHSRCVQHRLIHQSGFLRYCPECAKLQKKLYGEAFWQMLPQIDGLEYCPIHRCRILNSPIPVDRIKYGFYPASAVLNESCKPVEGVDFIWDDLFDQVDLFFYRVKV